jgi:hypothetical protein
MQIQEFVERKTTTREKLDFICSALSQCSGKRRILLRTANFFPFGRSAADLISLRSIGGRKKSLGGILCTDGRSHSGRSVQSDRYRGSRRQVGDTQV